jgi:hypothetical protein
MNGILISLAAVMTILAGQASTPAKDTYTYNLYVTKAVRFQNPDLEACVAATTMTMLNTISYTNDRPTYAPPTAQAAQPPMVWKPTVSGIKQTSIFRWARAHMTQPLWSPGVDGHGWRNALNYYGWGSVSAGVYTDQAYGNLDLAAKATVHAIAMTDEPVGILAQSGFHAQIVTGYKVTGVDPRTGSMDFKVLGIYLTDPLRERHRANLYVSIDVWKNGPDLIRYTYYQQPDSTLRDPLDGKIGKKEWWHRWVIVAPALPQ